jgi:6-bladed beta-propeller
MRGKQLQRIGMVMIFCLLWALGSHCEVAMAADWKGERQTIEGVLHVKNPNAPIHSAKTITPRELWRIGDEPDDLADEDEMIGFINQVLINEDGQFYLLDRAFSHIKVYSPQGEFQRVIGREGEGPGEFRQPGGFYFQKNGNIAVAQMMPGRIITVDHEGIPKGDIDFSNLGGMGMNILHRVEGGPGFGLVSMMIPAITDQGVTMSQKWFSIDDEGNQKSVYYEKKQESTTSGGGNVSIEMTSDDDIGRFWAQSPTGDAYLARRANVYQIEVFDHSGKLTHVIEREYDSVKRTKAELEAMRENAPQFGSGGGRVEMEFDEFRRDIVNLYPRPDGELWVTTSASDEDCEEDGICNIDVFDPEGRFVRQQNIVADYNPRRDEFRLVGDYLFILKEARTTPQTSTSSAGGMMMMVVEVGGSSFDEDDDSEPEPFRVVCYEL